MLKTLLLSGLLFTGMAAAQDVATVVLGGTGTNPGLQTCMDGIADMLSANGVKVKIASGEPKSRTAIQEEMKSSGAKALLYLTVQKAPSKRGNILVQSFVDGQQVWQEEFRGPMTGVSREIDYMRKMVEKVNEKLKKRIGDVGLPKS